MRNSKFTKLLSVILTAVLLFGTFASVLSFAEDEAVVEEVPSVEIISKNLNYASRTEIVYAVEATGIKETDSIVMLFWNDEQANYTYENALYRKSFYGKGTVLDVEGCYLFKSRGIAPKEINDSIYACPVIRHAEVVDGEVVVTYTYGNVLKYNVGMYAAEKLSETDNSAAQNKLYTSLIEYADAAGTKFGASEPDYVLAKVEDAAGSFGGFGAKYAIADKDGKLLLRAEAINADGKYFIKWVDEAGNDLSTARVAKVAAPTEAGVHVYTPVYGEAADSAYAGTHVLESFATGEVNVGLPNYAKDPDQGCYGSFSGSNMKRYNINKTISGIKFVQNIMPAYTAYDSATKTYTFAKNALDHYVFGMKDSYVITEDIVGDKEIYVDRGEAMGSGWTVGFDRLDKTVLDYKYVEYDVTFEDLTRSGVQLYISTTVRNSAGKEFAFRTNLFSTNTDEKNPSLNGKTYLYAEGNYDNYVKGEDGKVRTFSMTDGETVTIGIRFVEETIDATTEYYLEYYINGEYYGRLLANTFKYSSKTYVDAGFDPAGGYISYTSLNTVTDNKDCVYIDNVGYAK